MADVTPANYISITADSREGVQVPFTQIDRKEVSLLSNRNFIRIYRRLIIGNVQPRILHEP